MYKYIRVNNSLVFFRIAEKDLPKEKEWDKAAVEVRLKLYENMRKHVIEWETENMDKDTLKRIQTALENEFPKFWSDLNNLENDLSSRPAEISGTLPMSDDTPSVTPDFLKWIANLSVLQKVMIAPAAPVLLIGFVGRLPYVGYRHLKKYIDVKHMSGKYNKANGNAEKATVCTEYAGQVFTKITLEIACEDTIKEDMKIFHELLKKQEDKMKHQIENDRRLLQQLKSDSRDAKTVKGFYEPLLERVEEMNQNLVDFLIRNFPNLPTTF